MANYDMGQAALIHLMRESYKLFDVAAIGALRAVGRDIGTDSQLTLEELEGQVEEIQPGVVGLPVCPFAKAINTFRDCCGALPEELAILARHANNQGEAWVSAFCGIHQAIRRTRIGDSYEQIGCRSGTEVSIADQDIMSKEDAEELLKKYACVYAR
jgi:hypothetical protein